ncbi:MAG: hypothetical protein HQL01_10335 [Nitrospirae bacterium]|nr:hypothetical protein [Nitrospirota bacterium]
MAAAALDILLLLMFIALSIWERRRLREAAASYGRRIFVIIKLVKLSTLLLIIFTSITVIYTF